MVLVYFNTSLTPLLDLEFASVLELASLSVIPNFYPYRTFKAIIEGLC